ncbi:MAG: hypothetical protein ACXVKN_09640 [Acidimicrobiia bacterium]
MFEMLRESIEVLRDIAAVLDPSVLDGAEAMQIVEQASELERLAGAVRILAAGRVAQTGAWIGPDGAFRDAGDWMASVTGTTIGRAKATLQTAERLNALPETRAALRAGALSEVKVDAIASAATADPRAESTLLASASTEGVRGLKNACARVEAAASTKQMERYEAVRAVRSLRHRRISDVEGLLEMRGPIELTSGVMAALQPIETDLFDQARASGRREHPDTLAFDALVQMSDEAADVALQASGNRAPATIVVRVDGPALTRGTTQPGEICEIVGVGPVPVAIARKLMGDSILKVLVHDATDVLAISHAGRTIPTRMRTALEELFPECCIEGCHVNRHLEIDHNVPISEGGPTALWNLTRPCHFHHDYKHTHNLRIEGHGTNRHFVPAPTETTDPPDRTPERDERLDPDPSDLESPRRGRLHLRTLRAEREVARRAETRAAERGGAWDPRVVSPP